ncbi:hypothetical protein BABINDRAFT_162505 [Babjeviella inositovora NRRL Y-12698]|uniref:Uncharacterized protein n=1 Tax=Babjeviella inositovora NRRL Y-12698 TaxID=984486 RepID=A0A1E3QMA1_9ASCO|nr:uncharacterized protein BABINDRAFT_162505 [Babjeviella inositovora NRRL Y-12698]ODQ78823.1 hypothetical protein BABINDRAFT_162505 [Babjeviella inositovora NRRL Y-12698]
MGHLVQDLPALGECIPHGLLSEIIIRKNDFSAATNRSRMFYVTPVARDEKHNWV